MSEEEENTNPGIWVLIRGQASFESAEEALESLVQLKEVEFPDIFTDRDTELDSEENDGISIAFTHKDKYNRLNLSTDSSNQLRLTLSLEEDDTKEAGSVMGNILEHVPPITIDEKTIIKEYSISFESLNIPVDEGWDLDLVGVRIKHGGIDYIVQEGDDDSLRVTATDESDTKVEDSPGENFIVENIEETDRFIEEVL